MERSEIQNLILSEIKKVKRNIPDSIHGDDHLIEVWGFESIDMAELVARAEQYFRIEVPDSVWKQLITVNIIADYIYEHLQTDR
jgi:acyl carrier protein